MTRAATDRTIRKSNRIKKGKEIKQRIKARGLPQKALTNIYFVR